MCAATISQVKWPVALEDQRMPAQEKLIQLLEGGSGMNGAAGLESKNGRNKNDLTFNRLIIQNIHQRQQDSP